MTTTTAKPAYVPQLTKEHADKFASLFDRWQDEKGYEDFDEYKEAFQKALPEGADLTRMTARPFYAEVFFCNGRREWIRATARSVQTGYFA